MRERQLSAPGETHPSAARKLTHSFADGMTTGRCRKVLLAEHAEAIRAAVAAELTVPGL
jgi:hypothetical protein